jgi:hypothetical protein
MTGSIYLLQPDRQLLAMTEQPYDSEALLQALLADYPDLLVGDQIDPAEPRRWLLVSREMPVPSEEAGGGRWSLDHLFLDQDGVPTLVEVKRSTDSRIRREVVGQMLDYAANAVAYWPVERIRAAFEASTPNPAEVLQTFLKPNEDPDEFWARTKTNLQAGRIRMVFVADVIPPELRRIVEFLNRQMDPAEVLAVEIRQYVSGDTRSLVPRVLGHTAESRKSPAANPASRWDEARYFEHLAANATPEEVSIARELLDWGAKNTTRVWWGRGVRAGSFIPVANHGGADHQLFAVWSTGTIEIYFQWYAARPVFADKGKRLEMLARLNAIPGVRLTPDVIRRRPNLPLKLFVDPEARRQLIGAFEWYLDEVRAG